MTVKKNTISLYLFLAFLLLIPAIITRDRIHQQLSGEDIKPTLQATRPESSAISIFYPANDTTSGGITININATRVNRLNRTILIEVNATKMLDAAGGAPGWTNVAGVTINITCPNATILNYTMDETTPTSSIFKYKWNTSLSMDNGSYNMMAYPRNETEEWTAFNFTGGLVKPRVEIYNILPTVNVKYNSTSVYRNETISFNFTAFDPETSYQDLVWRAALYDADAGGSPWKTWQNGDELFDTYYFNGTDDDILGNYFIAMEVNDTSNGSTLDYFEFKVVNHEPVIFNVSMNATGELKRQTESINIRLNASDYEDNTTELQEVRAILQNQITKNNITSNKFSYNSTTKMYNGSIGVPAFIDTGNYTLILVAVDHDNGIGYWINETGNRTTVINNLPEVHGARVNNQTLDEGLHFTTNEVITIWANVSDVEGIEFVEIQLLHIESGKKIKFYTVLSAGYSIEVSTGQLVIGSWNIVVIAHDTNYEQSAINYTGIIEIDPDLSSATATVITVVLSAIGGFIVGGFFIWRYANARIKDIKSDLIIKSAKDDKDKKDRASKTKSKKKESSYKDTSDIDEPTDETTDDQLKEKEKPLPSSRKSSGKSKKTKSRF